MTFKKTYEEAKSEFKPLKSKGFIRKAPADEGLVFPAHSVNQASRRTGNGLKRSQKPMWAKSDTNLAAWGRRVRARDGNVCRFPGDCVSGDNRIDSHHIAPRGRRPDLIYVDANGICLCRTHHDWCHNNPMQAERMQLLNFDSYELAQKIKQGYVVPGDEDDTRITL